jgi:predicted AAA+ superfamily ATPase
MERLLYGKLLAWKASKYRKPLLLQGARQVGKTYLLKEFGRREFYKDTAAILLSMPGKKTPHILIEYLIISRFN